jgi:hypothetical protein
LQMEIYEAEELKWVRKEGNIGLEWTRIQQNLVVYMQCVIHLTFSYLRIGC